MAKKYLSIEEACAQLGITVDEMNRLREGGEIRGFSDRGTWKFKPEDIEELARTRQADSSPSVLIIDSDVGLAVDGDGSSVVLGTEDSSVVLSDEPEGSSVLLSDEDDVGQQPTIIRKDESALEGIGSDSDVRLVLDDSLTEDSSPDVVAAGGSDSDSDVRLVDDSSDSDVKLVSDASDSDVRLASPAPLSDESDSDVQLVSDGSQSEIVLESATGEGGSDSDVKLIGADAGTEEEIALAPLADSSPAVVDPESGISLEPADSGIAHEPADSGISLMDEDSGIALAADSGISLAGDSGIALEALNAAGGAAGGADLDETQFELDALDEDSEFELTKPASGSGSDTGVIVFDDDEVDDHAQTMVKGGSESGAFEFDDDLEVVDDVVGEDDELDDIDVFDAGDEDFADSFEAGESHAEFIAPVGVAAPVQQDWGIGAFLGLMLTTVMMIVCCVVMFDFVRSMWSWNEPSGFTSTLMGKIGGMFSK